MKTTKSSTSAAGKVKLAQFCRAAAAAAAVVLAAALLSVGFFSPGLDSRRPPAAGGGVLRDGDAELIPLDGGAVGPESLAFDADGGGPYTGASDGRILKWEGAAEGWIEYATVSPSPDVASSCKGSRDPKREHVCGRPLGLQFNGKGELFVADAYFGLMKVAAGDSAATVVVAGTQGVPFRFANGIDIDGRDGVVYFTDSSRRFQRRDFMSAVISGDRTGRLLSFDPATDEVRVLLDGLAFPNGVALSADGSFLLLAETTTCRLLKYGIHEAPPSPEVVAELPGFPDNIRRSPRGGFWVALHSKRGRVVEGALSRRWLRRLLLALAGWVDLEQVSAVMGRWRGAAFAVRVSGEGEVLEVAEGFGRRQGVRFISEVGEGNGSLWIGSVVMPGVGVYGLQHRQ